MSSDYNFDYVPIDYSLTGGGGDFGGLGLDTSGFFDPVSSYNPSVGIDWNNIFGVTDNNTDFGSGVGTGLVPTVDWNAPYDSSNPFGIVDTIFNMGNGGSGTGLGSGTSSNISGSLPRATTGGLTPTVPKTGTGTGTGTGTTNGWSIMDYILGGLGTMILANAATNHPDSSSAKGLTNPYSNPLWKDSYKGK